ncbi:hypothetical protein H8D59_03540 [bacterium]|nr:hypothetical protein [bacterium]MBL7052962.1 hypothetical protein [Candidatus Neomarinimicrobiota bacterium]
MKELIDARSPWCCGQMAVTSGDVSDAGLVQMKSLLSSAPSKSFKTHFIVSSTDEVGWGQTLWEKIGQVE